MFPIYYRRLKINSTVMSYDDDHQEFQEEYDQIKKDLRVVLITNGALLILLVALYFINRATGFLD